MKILANVVGILLGALFLFASVAFLFHLGPMPPPPPADTPAGQFTGAFMGTGYMHFVKVLELLGGLLVLVPRTRAIGLLILTPIVVNVGAFHIFITSGAGLVGLPLAAALMTSFLVGVHRRGLAALLADRGA